MKNFMLVLLLFVMSIFNSFGQYSNKNWLFGTHAGLSFNQLTGGYPTAFSGSQLDTEEGVACISDDSGNLLFYTDGTYLWDYNHALISSTLKGNLSSTQSAIIVPNPGLVNNSRDYYVFTVDAWGGCTWTNPAGDGIYYTVVNVNFNNPFTVTIVQENIPLKPDVSFRENLMAVSKFGSPGYWVISKQYAVNNTTGNNAFYVWEVTATGVDTVPQIYNVGSVQSPTGSLPGNPSGNASLGYLKISPNGNILAMANNHLNYVELYRFNPATGAVLPFVTTGNTVLSNIPYAYSVEFSPNSQLLYVSRTYNGTIYQFDLNSANIASSMLAISPSITGTYYIKAAIQLGPDNKIYIVKYNSNKIAVINNPDVIGNGCNVVDNAITLTTGTLGQNGLPTFVPTKIQYVPVNNSIMEESVSVYPNPCTNSISFDYSKVETLSVELTNIDNKVVLTETLPAGQHEINIENLPNAVYFLKITTQSNTSHSIRTSYRKIVKIS